MPALGFLAILRVLAVLRVLEHPVYEGEGGEDGGDEDGEEEGEEFDEVVEEGVGYHFSFGVVVVVVVGLVGELVLFMMDDVRGLLYGVVVVVVVWFICRYCCAVEYSDRYNSQNPVQTHSKQSSMSAIYPPHQFIKMP